MKTLFHLFASFLLISLAACSSGSPGNVIDETGETTTNAVTTSENGASNGTNGEFADIAGANGEATQAAQNDGQDTEAERPVINTDSELGQFQSSIHLLVGQSLLALNQSLSMGELLSLQQETCLGAFDPALGQPLLAIDCEKPLSISNVPIYADIASFNNTPDCVASVQNNNTTNCTVSEARLTVNTLWVIPATEPGQPERPQPISGALIDYSIEQNRLVIESLPAALAGSFRCEFDLATGLLATNSVGSACETQLVRLKGLIEQQLATVN